MIDIEWARNQLILSGWDPALGGDKQAVHTSIMMLIREINNQHHTDDSLRRAVITSFAKLALGEELVPYSNQHEPKYKPLELGNVSLGAYIRVKEDAYEGRYAVHNGRTGRFSAANGGNVTITYLDDNSGTGQPHPVDKLEVLIT